MNNPQLVTSSPVDNPVVILTQPIGTVLENLTLQQFSSIETLEQRANIYFENNQEKFNQMCDEEDVESDYFVK